MGGQYQKESQKTDFLGLNWIHRDLNGGQWRVFMKMVKGVISKNDGNFWLSEQL